MATELPPIIHAIGLAEELANATSNQRNDFMPAAVAGLSDGDIVTLHQPYKGADALLYGETSYSTGVLPRPCTGMPS